MSGRAVATDAPTATGVAIEITGLSKYYGETRALEGVDLTVPEGSVYGFLGPNGAGKTTALRILTGMARPSVGGATVFGHDVVRATNDVRALIGFLPDVPGYYPWMTAEEFLRFAGRLHGVSGRLLDERVASLLDLAGLAGVTQRVGGFSRGMKQRLGVAQALINAPKLLMLDEPTSALDPMGRKDVLEMIAALRGKTTVFFSTHILTDVERVCDMVAILDHGRVVRQATIAELKREGHAVRLAVEVERGAEDLEALLSAQPWAMGCERDGQTVRCVVGDLHAARTSIPAIVASKHMALVRMVDEEPTLEDVFVELVGGRS
ncbi:MAG: ABC transporter ATP-binding protein [Actinobacteria bacterium]|nr:ABC transporter ATP-binding protein [Actinomycetota bacterium]